MDEIVGQDIFFSWENVLIGYENEVGLVQLDIVILDMFELVMVVVLVKLYIDVFYQCYDCDQFRCIQNYGIWLC